MLEPLQLDSVGKKIELGTKKHHLSLPPAKGTKQPPDSDGRLLSFHGSIDFMLYYLSIILSFYISVVSMLTNLCLELFVEH